MMKSLIKFVTKEELVNMLIQIRNFRNPNTGKHYKKYKTWQEHMDNKWGRAEHYFQMRNLDFVDVLICGEGYVRYYYNKSTETVDMLKLRFGFLEE